MISGYIALIWIIYLSAYLGWKLCSLYSDYIEEKNMKERENWMGETK